MLSRSVNLSEKEDQREVREGERAETRELTVLMLK